MKFFGKELPTDKINFVMNCVSFILGVIFFIRMQYKLSHEQTIAPNFNAERDSLIRIETRVGIELKQIHQLQDSLSKLLLENKTYLKETENKVSEKRFLIKATLQNEWDKLPTNKQDEYVQKIISQLKNQNHETH